MSTAGHRTDGTLDGVNFQLVSKVEGTRPYRKRWVRQFQPQAILTPEGDRMSRTTEVGFMQDDWSQGAHWEGPLLRPPVDKSYSIDSENVNAWIKPGWLIPHNEPNQVTNTNLMDSSPLIIYNRKVYCIGSTSITGGGSIKDVYSWDTSSQVFVRETGFHAGMTGAEILGAVADPGNDRIYLLSTTRVWAIDPITPANGTSLLTHGLTIRYGANLMLHDDRLLLYDGAKLWEVEDRTGTAALSSTPVANDGMGGGLLRRMQSTSDNIVDRNSLSAAIATPDGIYYFKNVLKEGAPEAWVFRIDRDSSGNDISSPIAVLDRGMLAIDMQYHLGSVFLTTTPDWQRFLTNDRANTGDVRVVLYAANRRDVNIIGLIDGEGPTESPCRILGTDVTTLYIASHKTIWAYDGLRGGIHPFLTDPSPTDEAFFSMAKTYRNAADESSIIFKKPNRYMCPMDMFWNNDPDVVGSFGDPPAETYVFVSNYFDFSLAMEDKTLESATIAADEDMSSTNHRWTLFVEVDDSGTWTECGHVAGTTVLDLASLSLTGKRFRYKLVYETRNQQNYGVNRVIFKATAGEVVPIWSLIVDAAELRNVNNLKQNPQEVFEAWETMMESEAPVTYVDRFRSADRADTSTHTVKIIDCEFFKQSPTEGEIHVTMVGTDQELG